MDNGKLHIVLRLRIRLVNCYKTSQLTEYLIRIRWYKDI